MRNYTSIPGKQTVEHVSSDTWRCGDRTLRIHQFRCRACHGTFFQSDEVYSRCPLCGLPIQHFREAV